jgi:hypothetical protein
MGFEFKFPLLTLLRGALSGEYTHHHLMELHRLCYTIAHRLIHRKVVVWKLSPDFIGLSENDITHDCIAELFTRSSTNELIEFCRYFEYQRIIVDAQPEDLLLIHLRRLVSSIVNDNLFRLYREADAPLGKILRNIKMAVIGSSELN